MLNDTLSLDTAAPEWAADRPVGELTLVQVAERLEKITGWIEAERVKEREARAAYKAVADKVEARVREIRGYAETLLAEQRRRMHSFSGLIDRKGPDPLPASMVEPTPSRGGGESGRMTFSDALMAVWTLDDYKSPLTTEQILDGLAAVGYASRAAPRSFRSALNQALAKLCRDGKVIKYRLDGSRIPDVDRLSRARRYMAASVAPQTDQD
jgi:hypothetical protein